MGCIFTNENYEEDFSSDSEDEPLPLIEPIKTQIIIYEEKIKKLYYIEHIKQTQTQYGRLRRSSDPANPSS